jgi:hypothetical protein
MIWVIVVLVFLVGFIAGGVWDRMWYNSAIHNFTNRGSLIIHRPTDELEIKWAKATTEYRCAVRADTFGKAVTDLLNRLRGSGDV